MPTLELVMDGSNWPELRDHDIIHLGNNAPAIGVAVLDAGMSSGRPSIMMRLDLPDGRIVLAETSMRLFVHAASMMLAKYPDLFDEQ
jgi:hypothetical protein